MEKIQHQGTIQRNFGLLPKGIILGCVLGCGVLNEVVNQPEYIGILADIPERIVMVGMAGVNKVKYPDGVPMPQKEAPCGAQDFPFGVCNDKAGITEHHIGEYHADGLHGTTAAHYDL